MPDQMQKWHNFFAKAEFPLSFQDRDQSSLQLRTNRPSRHDPNPQVYFLSAGGYDRFKFIAVDKADYRKGYRILHNDRYISGFGTFQGNMTSNCLKTTTEARDAFIFIPEFTGPFTFYLKYLADDRVLITRPWDRYTGGILSGRDATLLRVKGDNGFGAVQQIFKMPQWPMRALNMAYMPLDIHFNLVYEGSRLYAANNQLTLGQGDDASAIIAFSSTNPSSFHAGYILSVGGRYVRMNATDQPVSLVENKAQATELCPILNDDGELSLWHSESDHVLTVKNNIPVFSLFEDTALIATAWSVKEDAPHSFHTQGAVGDTEKGLTDTTYLKKIVEELNKNDQSKKGATWNYSFDNTLPDDWFIATPESSFWTAGNFSMPIEDTTNTNFNLSRCEGSGDTAHPCVRLDSSVTEPGGSPDGLHAGHSRSIYENIYNLIIKGRKIVDVLGLLRKDSTPSGEFMSAVRNAITYLSNEPSAKDVQIRILFGEPLGWAGDHAISLGPYKSTRQLLTDLTSGIRQNTMSKMKIYVVYSSSVTPLYWNHAKIVAADGNHALVGGHNMWHGAYLREAPVLDTTMKLSGHAATDAHQFADRIWSSQGAFLIDFDFDASSYDASSKNYQSGSSSLPVNRLFNSLLPETADKPYRNKGTGTPVLSVGRSESEAQDAAASDKALLRLIDVATDTVYISAQCLSYTLLRANWWTKFLDTVISALNRNVAVTIFLSNPSNGQGSYKGEPPLDVFAQIRNRITGKTAMETNVILNRLKVRSLPTATSWGLSVTALGISNHAKVIMVDKKAFSIGSQNYYPCWPATMSEFTYIVENATKAQDLYDRYFKVLESWALISPEFSPVPSSKTYHILLLTIKCISTSGGGIPGQIDSDDCLLELDGRRVWPSNARYISMVSGESRLLNIPFDIKNTDNERKYQLYEWDYLSNDNLADFTFHPDTEIKYNGTSSAKLRDLQPGNYTINGKKIDNNAEYSIDFSFSTTD